MIQHNSYFFLFRFLNSPRIQSQEILSDSFAALPVASDVQKLNAADGIADVGFTR